MSKLRVFLTGLVKDVHAFSVGLQVWNRKKDGPNDESRHRETQNNTVARE